jgi:very-short-patch-repair endonuclease
MLSSPVPAAAATQDGLFTRADARADGYTRARIRRRLASGWWQPVVGEVLAAAATPLTFERRCRAVVLAADGVISHGSAAALWGLPACAHDTDIVHLVVDVARNPRLPGVRIHRVPIDDGERSQRCGIAVTSRRRTVLDCLAWLRVVRARELLDHALNDRLLTIDELAAEVARSGGRHGIRQLRALLAEARSGSRSEAERLLHELLRDARVGGWQANARLEPMPGVVAVADVWFPVSRVVVEVDGRAWHVAGDRFQRDRTRQNALVLSGRTVLRFTWEDLVRRPRRVVAEILAATREPTDAYAPEMRRTGP